MPHMLKLGGIRVRGCAQKRGRGWGHENIHWETGKKYSLCCFVFCPGEGQESTSYWGYESTLSLHEMSTRRSIMGDAYHYPNGHNMTPSLFHSTFSRATRPPRSIACVRAHMPTIVEQEDGWGYRSRQSERWSTAQHPWESWPRQTKFGLIKSSTGLSRQVHRSWGSVLMEESQWPRCTWPSGRMNFILSEKLLSIILIPRMAWAKQMMEMNAFFWDVQQFSSCQAHLHPPVTCTFQGYNTALHILYL